MLYLLEKGNIFFLILYVCVYIHTCIYMYVYLYFSPPPKTPVKSGWKISLHISESSGELVQLEYLLEFW